MMRSPNDPTPMERVRKLLGELAPDQTPGSIGDQLKHAIIDAILEAERRQGEVIISAISEGRMGA